MFCRQVNRTFALKCSLMRFLNTLKMFVFWYYLIDRDRENLYFFAHLNREQTALCWSRAITQYTIVIYNWSCLQAILKLWLLMSSSTNIFALLVLYRKTLDLWGAVLRWGALCTLTPLQGRTIAARFLGCRFLLFKFSSTRQWLSQIEEICFP